MSSVILNDQQNKAENAIIEGHNLILTGHAGTGKSLLLKDAVKLLRFVGKNVAILCTTGISCLQYLNFDATTVHSWAGLYDGRYDDNTLRNLVLHDENYEKVRLNARNCDVVIIDEISMLSKKDFEQFELVCRTARGNPYYFGGLQIIVSGDFFQLPPVSNPLYNDEGQFCFTSNIWQSVFCHRINLEVNVRQKETELAEAVKETATGIVSRKCDVFLKSLEREIENVPGTVHLFAKNIEASIFNNEQLEKLNTEEKIYIATKNNGSQKHLNKILAPQYLHVKKGCSVMLLRNLGGKLVNGLCGHVKEMKCDAIIVYFPTIDETHSVGRHQFTVYDLKKKRNIAERLQFPLQLSYALTVHKSQGMTLNHVVVHCKGIFQPCQLSVAMGRATSLTGLQLVNYRKELCMLPKKSISEFYGTDTSEFVDDPNECCKKHLASETETCGDIHIQDCDDESDFDEKTLDILENIDVGKIPLLPDSVSINQLVQDVKVNQPITEKQVEINQICSCLNNMFLEIFISKQYEQIRSMIPTEITATCTSASVWTNILSMYHTYIQSEEHMCTLPLLYEYNINLSENQKYVGSKLVLSLLKMIVHSYAKEVSDQLDSFPQIEKQRKNSDFGRAKIRYVGGMCVSRTKKHFSNIFHSNVGNPNKGAKDKYKKAKIQIEFLCSLEAQVEDIDFNDRTFEEIERLENATKCLTYINDKCFNFFMVLNDKIYKLLNCDVFKKEKESLFEYIFSCIKEDKDLNTLWTDICDQKIEMEYSYAVLEKVVKLYLKVCHKQFLKDTKDKLKFSRKKRHRKEIEDKQSKHPKMDTSVTMKDIETDVTTGKEASHLKLKLNCITDREFFNTRDFTKKDIAKLCLAYNIHFNPSMKKETLAVSLAKGITSSNEMKNTSVFCDTEIPSTSDTRENLCSKKKGKAKHQVKEKEKEKENLVKHTTAESAMKNTKPMKTGYSAIIVISGYTENVAIWKMTLSGNKSNWRMQNGTAPTVHYKWT